MTKIIPAEIKTRDLHQFLVASVSPRPIALVSTVDEDGNKNLAPYSFFNVFSSNPPILVFSSNRRVMDNTTKDTLHNIKTTKECVINVVSHDIVRQMTIASVQFDSNVDEFVKSGLTPIQSDMVKPFRVEESPVNMECKVRDIITLGTHGGAGHLIICDIVCIHIKDEIIDENNRIDPQKIDLMGRMGRAYYVRVHGDAIETIVQPVTQLVIGYDALPEIATKSDLLSANELGRLAGNFNLPTKEEMESMRAKPEIQALIKGRSKDDFVIEAKKYLGENDVSLALGILLIGEEM